MKFDDKNKMQIKPLGFIQTPGLLLTLPKPTNRSRFGRPIFKKQHPTSITRSLHLPFFYLIALITVRHDDLLPGMFVHYLYSPSRMRIDAL